MRRRPGGDQRRAAPARRDPARRRSAAGRASGDDHEGAGGERGWRRRRGGAQARAAVTGDGRRQGAEGGVGRRRGPDPPPGWPDTARRRLAEGRASGSDRERAGGLRGRRRRGREVERLGDPPPARLLVDAAGQIRHRPDPPPARRDPPRRRPAATGVEQEVERGGDLRGRWRRSAEHQIRRWHAAGRIPRRRRRGADAGVRRGGEGGGGGEGSSRGRALIALETIWRRKMARGTTMVCERGDGGSDAPSAS